MVQQVEAFAKQSSYLHSVSQNSVFDHQLQNAKLNAKTNQKDYIKEQIFTSIAGTMKKKMAML